MDRAVIVRLRRVRDLIVMTRRIERAKALLRAGELSVTEVCSAVGYSSLSVFSSRFSELVGESPGAHRARAHESFREVPGYFAKILHARCGVPAGRDTRSRAVARPARKSGHDDRSLHRLDTSHGMAPAAR